ncbi:MAG TPA: polysaccharide deacetylase family protein [Xanthobacteraceae bacterium]|nr:polysaccharide deacetylase family protein [Xanthobacteraceae bacterium]
MTRAREIAFALALTTISIPSIAAERPPQFIAIAFDNCTELSRWKELSEFAARLNAKGEAIHFTFFVSGINFLANEKRDLYQGPRERRGYSNINFGGSPQDIAERVRYINEMHAAGHEIASHAVGHFDGKHWSEAEWAQEFKSYNRLVDRVGENNGLEGAKFSFTSADIKGFRAPYLSASPGLYPALKAAGFRYDTSDTMRPNLWPEKKDGIWRFNLAEIRLHRSRKMTLSMDYNFLVVQSLGLDVSARRDRDRDEMLETYLDYFKANYFGNRAPIHIGHHFFGYHGGVYNQALLTFIERVCGLPEVRCVTYSKLADFMDGLSADTLKAYQKGDFPHATQPLILLDTPAAELR